MRAVRLVVGSFTVIIGAYLLLNANGVCIAMQERSQGWNITPLPAYPVAHIVAYASSEIALQFLAAWLLMPATVEKGTPFWRRYAATVAICILAGLVAAFVLFFLVQALLDAGKI
jgi:hypothetical protein